MTGFLALFAHFPLRLALYAGLEAVALQVIVVTGMIHGPELFNEDGPIEWTQFTLIAASAMVLFWRSYSRVSPHSSLFFIAALLALIAAMRELDHFLDALLFKGAYKYPGAVAGTVGFYQVWRHCSQVRQDIHAFTRQPPFFLFAFGFFLVVVLGQILGQRELWSALMERPLSEAAKRTVEETIETAGYLMICFGVVETFYLREQEEADNR